MPQEWQIAGTAAVCLAAGSLLGFFFGSRFAWRRPTISITTRSKKSQSWPRKTPQNRKIFVLDTNILLGDPSDLFNFQANDVCVPLAVIEELDKVHPRLARVKRAAQYVLQRAMRDGSPEAGYALAGACMNRATGRLFVQSFASPSAGVDGLKQGKGDNKVLACALQLLDGGYRPVLVTKDVNLALKAQAMGLMVQEHAHP